jgi:hypothetical protein
VSKLVVHAPLSEHEAQVRRILSFNKNMVLNVWRCWTARNGAASSTVLSDREFDSLEASPNCSDVTVLGQLEFCQ